MIKKIKTQITIYIPTSKEEGVEFKTDMQAILKYKWLNERRKLLKSRNNWIIKKFWEILIETCRKYTKKRRLKRSTLHLMQCLESK